MFQSIVEKVTYTSSDENAAWTVAKRSAWIDSQVFGFSRAIQAFGMDRFKKNCNKMANGFEFVLARLFPATAALNSRETPLQHTTEKLKDAAKKASDLAKSQANNIFAACESNSE